MTLLITALVAGLVAAVAASGRRRARDAGPAPVPDASAVAAPDPVSVLAAEIDRIGLEAGAAPSATVGLGEHVIVPGVITATEAADAGQTRCTVTLDWSRCHWFDADGIERRRHEGPGVLDTVRLLTPCPAFPGEPVHVPFTVEPHSPTEVRITLAPGPIRVARSDGTITALG